MKRNVKNTWSRFAEWLTVRKLGILALILVFFVAIVGYLNQHNGLYLGEFLGGLIADFYTNVSTDLASIALTVLIIDALNERRADRQLKAQLIREMGSIDRGITSRALRELDAHGWLRDGSLRKEWFFEANFEGVRFPKADLRDTVFTGANLQGATLISADLRGAYFTEANLQNAIVKDEQLAQLASLWGATMYNGRRYDGRFNLSVDVDLAREKQVNLDDPQSLAKEYGVAVEDYLRGQEWAREHLPAMHGNREVVS